jgi:hypothetical protein
MLAALKPVGYHAWLDSARLVTYVLGTPSTLHFVSRDGAIDEVRAHDVGRAMHRVPSSATYSFTQRDSAKVLWIMFQPIAGGPAERVIRAASDNEFHAWVPSGELLTASRGVLQLWNRERGDASAWIPFADLMTNGVKSVSRLAVSPDGRWLAFVAEPTTP